MLFHRAADPEQKENLWHERPEERGRMLKVMRQLVDRAGAPPEIYTRLKLGDSAETVAVATSAS